MSEVKEKKPEVWAWKKPDHKLSHEEVEAILEHWDYDPEHGDEYEEYNENGIPLLDDEFGNPSYGSFEALYEKRHNISYGLMTLDELYADWEQMLAEEDNEESRPAQQIPA